MPSHWLLALPLVFLALFGCAGRDSPLLKLRRLEPHEVEPGSELYVEGQGFPTGRDGIVHFRGRTYRPGQPVLRVDQRFAARALSRDRAAVTVDGGLLEALGNRGTFTGSLELRFATPPNNLWVSGQLRGVRLDLAGPPHLQGPAREQLHQRAQETLLFVGLELDDAVDTHGGLRVMGTVAGGAAAQAGLIPGDVLLEANGVTLHSLGDLAPPPGARFLQLQLLRAGRRTTERWSLAGFELAVLDPALQPVALLLIACLWFLAFFGPFASPSLWLARLQSRIRYGDRPLSLGLWDHHQARLLGGGSREEVRPPPGRSWDTLPAVLASLLLFLHALLDAHYGVRALDALQLYLVMTGLLAWAAQRPEDRGLWVRLRRARTPLLQLGLMVLILTCTGLVTGARSLHDLVETQGALPVRWGIFTQPALFLLFPVFILVEGRPTPVGAGSSPWTRGLTYAGLVIARLLVCGVGAAVFLGGWASQEFAALGPTRAHLLGATLFALKAYGMALLLHAAQALAIGRRGFPWSQLSLCALAIASTLGFVLFGGHEEARLFCGTVLSTAAALVTVTAGVQVLLSKAPMGSRPEHSAPFR